MFELAEWVAPEHRIPLMFALSLYHEPIEFLEGFELIYLSHRFGIWTNGSYCVVGCRGTARGKKGFHQDVNDDRIIAGMTTGSYCELSLVQQVAEKILEYGLQEEQLVFCGHSLGGSAAMCLTSLFDGSVCIAFNAGAPPTNPVLEGPGPGRAVHYHIFGDIISSHMGPQAATIIRIKKPGPTWGYEYPHSADRMFADDGEWEYATIDEEQESWMKTGDQRIPLAKFWTRQAACSVPIPGSTVRCSFLDRINIFNTTV